MGGMTMTEGVTIDEVQADVSNLFHLLSVANELLGEMHFGTGDERNKEMDKLSALNSIAEDRAREIMEKISDNYSSLRGR
ncbi:unnamed protein product [Ciceribacter sp. T2.26MG-112.2]|nr:unnamed protein product [Ciceribacter naphthalenivorans]